MINFCNILLLLLLLLLLLITNYYSNQKTRGPVTESREGRGIHGGHSRDAVPYTSHQRRQAERGRRGIPLIQQ